MSSGIRPVTPDEVELPINEETKLVAMMAATVMAGYRDLSYHIAPEEAVDMAYSLLDVTITRQQARQESRLDAELRRRRGY